MSVEATPRTASPTPYAIAALVLLVALIATWIVLAQNVMNTKQLQALTEGAAEQGTSYRVEIHNPWTGKYSFTTLD